MQELSKSSFKAKVLEYFRHVEQAGEEIIITNHGEPTIRITPYHPKRDVAEVFGDLRRKSIDLDAIIEPTTDEWQEL